MSNSTKQNVSETINGFLVEIEYITDDEGTRPISTISKDGYSASWEVLEDHGGIENGDDIRLVDRLHQLEIQDWLEDMGYFD